MMEVGGIEQLLKKGIRIRAGNSARDQDSDLIIKQQ
jgi:hypothetical protein